jgi:hypothetical protein
VAQWARAQIWAQGAWAQVWAQWAQWAQWRNERSGRNGCTSDKILTDILYLLRKFLFLFFSSSPLSVTVKQKKVMSAFYWEKFLFSGGKTFPVFLYYSIRFNGKSSGTSTK